MTHSVELVACAILQTKFQSFRIWFENIPYELLQPEMRQKNLRAFKKKQNVRTFSKIWSSRF